LTVWLVYKPMDSSRDMVTGFTFYVSFFPLSYMKSGRI
jgi:hypothetical protein